MPLSAILEDWSEYETYKQSRDGNLTDFVTEDSWEVSYLTQKIISAYPGIQPSVVANAIASCGRRISRPRHRRLLVQCVMKELEIG